MSSFLACCFFSGTSYAATNQGVEEQLESLRILVQNNAADGPVQIDYFQTYFSNTADPYNESIFLNIWAYAHLLKQELETAYEKLLLARTKADISNNEYQLAESFRIEGAVLDTIGEYGAALEALNNAFALYDGLQSSKVLGVYSSLSNVYSSLKNYPAMLQNAYRMLAVAQEYNDKIHEGLAYYRIALAQTRLANPRDAAVNFSLAEKILTDINYPFIGIIYYSIAEVNQTQGNVDAALKRISQSIEADRKVGFLYNEVPRLLLLAEIYRSQGDIELAISELKKGVNQDALKKDKIQFLQILERLIELTELTDNESAQLGFLKQYNTLYQQSFNQKQAQMLGINNVRLNVFEKDKAIKLLQKENELQLQSNLIQQQNIRYQVVIILTILVALLLVLALLIRTRRQRTQLNRYSIELKQATQAKSDFLARMSHEIRTPINAISGLTKLMQRSADKPEDITNLRQIDEASISLLGVINDILDFSKIEAGKLDIESTSFQLDKVISQSIRLQSIKAHEKNIELIQHIARDVPLFLQGDGMRIQQILINLLSNAVKFTDEGLVSVTVKNKETEQGLLLEFAVTDSGIGLSQNQIDGLFESFAQVDESISRKYGGTGLGLAICKQLVELMQGKIWIESKLGQGSTFYFTVPVQEDKNQHISSPSKQLSGLKVLVADDVYLSRQVIADALLNANITPDLANGGQQTLNKLRYAAAEHQPYELLILDWKMPDIDGLEVAAIINQEFKANKPKIIMLSAFDFSHMRQAAKQLGIKHFIEKPFSASELINKLQEVVFNIKANASISFTEMKTVPDLSGKRILLAEDNKLNQKVALGFLKYTNAQVVLAENGREVIEAFKNQVAFDCILMDVQMPEMDGLTATSTLRNELNCTIPIIAMTANAMKLDIQKSIDVGMTAHINKPIDPEYFYQVIAEILLTSSQALTPSSPVTALPTEEPLATNPIETLLIMDQQQAMQKRFIDEETFTSMLKDFVVKEPTINTLGTLIENKDYQGIYGITHDVLPALTYIGAFNIAKLAKSIELIIYNKKQTNTQDFTEQLNQFHQAMVGLVIKINKQLAESSE
ncbi:tetratricopeptide repeat-containing hybrid sensor histidine kinase/response regulator [Paraglaciecola hydrolytica]|uniref:tetratricopeptide repeat-containing hybrid sensor histidine kinase/response regulator n=1 Tax=Paraglaciecola hydrolytica TaxID=1799789 RepID=UPI001F39FF29|nr:response regulator [Paraglaciecola hydrolytica]